MGDKGGSEETRLGVQESKKGYYFNPLNPDI